MLPRLHLSEIKRWIGKYPSDEIDGAQLFSTKAMNDSLKRLLGNDKYNEFLSVEEIGPQTPVEFHNGIVHFTVCQKHYCDHKFYFLYDIKSQQLFVCERNLEHKIVRSSNQAHMVTWFSDKGRHTVIDADCEFYDEKVKEVNWSQTIGMIPQSLR